MNMIFPYGINYYEIYSDLNLQKFTFMIFQLSENIFVIRPLKNEIKLDSGDGYSTSFDYSSNIHEQVSKYTIVSGDYYKDLLDFISRNNEVFSNNIIQCIKDFDIISKQFTVYYIHPKGELIKIYTVDKYSDFYKTLSELS